jgi:hypothetical protein
MFYVRMFKIIFKLLIRNWLYFILLLLTTFSVGQITYIMISQLINYEVLKLEEAF